MILTIDTGLSNILKICTVDDSYTIREQRLEPVPRERLQDKFIEVVNQSGLEKLAIAATWFISEDNTEGFIEKDGKKEVYINTKKIKECSSAKNIIMYNDAEATALALNLDMKLRVIQQGNRHLPDCKTLVYLGTGFQMVRNYYFENDKEYLPQLGGGLMASVPLSIRKILSWELLDRIVEEVGIGSMARLRHTHLLSARGLQYIHTADTGEKKEASQLIEEGEKHRETFILYSQILGTCLQNFASTAGLDQALYIGGTFAAAVAPCLDYDAIRESFAIGEHVIRYAYDDIPIYLIEEPFAGNLGAAYGLNRDIESTTKIPYRA